MEASKQANEEGIVGDQSEQDMNLILIRASDSSGREFIHIDGQKVAREQLAYAYAYLATPRGKRASGKRNVIISAVRRREALLIEEVMVSLEMILRRRVKRLLPTTITRISGHEGYVLLFDEVCALSATEFEPSQCIGICNKAAARNEQQGSDAHRAAVSKYNAVAVPPATDLLATRLRTIANWDLKYTDNIDRKPAATPPEEDERKPAAAAVGRGRDQGGRERGGRGTGGRKRGRGGRGDDDGWGPNRYVQQQRSPEKRSTRGRTSY